MMMRLFMVVFFFFWLGGASLRGAPPFPLPLGALEETSDAVLKEALKPIGESLWYQRFLRTGSPYPTPQEPPLRQKEIREILFRFPWRSVGHVEWVAEVLQKASWRYEQSEGREKIFVHQLSLLSFLSSHFSSPLAGALLRELSLFPRSPEEALDILQDIHTFLPPKPSHDLALDIARTVLWLHGHAEEKHLLPSLLLFKKTAQWKKAFQQGKRPLPSFLTPPPSLSPLINHYIERWADRGVDRSLRGNLELTLSHARNPVKLLWALDQSPEFMNYPDLYSHMFFIDRHLYPEGFTAVRGEPSDVLFRQINLFRHEVDAPVRPVSLLEYLATLKKWTVLLTGDHLRSWFHRQTYENARSFVRTIHTLFEQVPAWPHSHVETFLKCLPYVPTGSILSDYLPEGIPLSLWPLVESFIPQVETGLDLFHDLCHLFPGSASHVRSLVHLYADVFEDHRDAPRLFLHQHPEQKPFWEDTLGRLRTQLGEEATLSHQSLLENIWITLFRRLHALPRADIENFLLDVQIAVATPDFSLEIAQRVLRARHHQEAPRLLPALLTLAHQMPLSIMPHYHIHRVTGFKIASAEIWKKMTFRLQELTPHPLLTISRVGTQLQSYARKWGQSHQTLWLHIIDQGYRDVASGLEGEIQASTGHVLAYLEQAHPLSSIQMWFETFMQDCWEPPLESPFISCPRGIWERALLTLGVLPQLDPDLIFWAKLSHFYQRLTHEEDNLMQPIFQSLSAHRPSSLPPDASQPFANVWPLFWPALQAAAVALLGLDAAASSEFLNLRDVKRRFWVYGEALWPYPLLSYWQEERVA